MSEYYDSTYHRIESSYWWFVGRRDMIARLLRDEPRSSRVLDIGCSGGHTLSMLKGMGFRDLSGIDTSRNAIALCRKRGLNNVSVMDGASPDFKDRSFDIIIASDVLEHIRDADRAVSSWHRILKAGGRIVVFVPAFEFLWSRHDADCGHYRRYSLSGLVSGLKAAGFSIERASHWNIAMFAPSVANRLLANLTGRGMAHEDLHRAGALSNSMLSSLLKFENALLMRASFPLGVSAFVVAKRPA